MTSQTVSTRKKYKFMFEILVAHQKHIMRKTWAKRWFCTRQLDWWKGGEVSECQV